MVELAVAASLQHISGEVCIDFGIGLCVGQQLLEEGDGGRHVLAQTAEGDVGALGTWIDADVAGQTIEFALHLFGSHVAGA